MMCHQTKYGWKRISTYEHVAENHILVIWAFNMTLTLNFSPTLWLMMMHHNTKFGDKWFSSSEDLIQTNIHWHFEVLLQPWPWIQQSFFFFFFTRRSGLLIPLKRRNWLHNYGSAVQVIVESHILITWAITATLTLKTVNQFFHMTLPLIKMHHNTKFGYKRLNGSGDCIQTHTHTHTHTHNFITWGGGGACIKNNGKIH